MQSDPLLVDHLRLHPHNLFPRHWRHHLRCHCWAPQVVYKQLVCFVFTLQQLNNISCFWHPFLSVGSTTDEHGHTRPVAFMPYRVNGQYIMEVEKKIFLSPEFGTNLFLGACQQLYVFPRRCWSHGNTCNSVSNSVFEFSLEKVLDQTHNPSTPKINRMMLQVWNQLI